MKYTQATFSTPVSNGKLTQEEYEIRVGLRCPKCGSPDKDTHYMIDAPHPQSENPCPHEWHDRVTTADLIQCLEDRIDSTQTFAHMHFTKTVWRDGKPVTECEICGVMSAHDRS